MLLTVTCPANSPSTSTTNGIAWSSRANFESRLTIPRKVAGRPAASGGIVASHGLSHSALRVRASRQYRESDYSIPSKVHDPCYNVTGQWLHGHRRCSDPSRGARSAQDLPPTP